MIEPHLRGRLDGVEVGWFDAFQKVLFDVAHPRFDAPNDRKAVVAGEVVIAPIEHRCRTGQALQDSRLKVVDLMCR
jgi:hypothetical protein